MERNTRHFVLTNYREWCFGGFSLAGTMGFARKQQKRDCDQPTILQMLLLWMNDSLALDSGKYLPQVSRDTFIKYLLLQ